MKYHSDNEHKGLLYQSIEVITRCSYCGIRKQYIYYSKKVTEIESSYEIQEHEAPSMNPNIYEKNLVVVTFSKSVSKGKKRIWKTIARPISEFEIFKESSVSYGSLSPMLNKYENKQCFLYSEDSYEDNTFLRTTFFCDGKQLHFLNYKEAMLVWKHFLASKMYSAEEFDLLFQESETYVNNLNMQDIIDGYSLERKDWEWCRPGKEHPYRIYEYFRNENLNIDDPYILSFLPPKCVQLYSGFDVSEEEKREAIRSCGGLGRDKKKEKKIKNKFLKCYDVKKHVQRLVFLKIQQRHFEVDLYLRCCRLCDSMWGLVELDEVERQGKYSPFTLCFSKGRE